MLPVVRSKRELSIVFSKKLPKYFTKPEIDLILQAVRDNPKKHLLLSLLWQTGARVSEILTLKVENVDFYTKTIRLQTLKIKKGIGERVLPMQDGLMGLLGVYITSKRLQRGDRLMGGITRQRAFQIVKEAVLKAGLDEERAHPHTFRHSFAIHCILNGVSVLVVKQWLGHSNIQNTLIYMQVLESDTRHIYEGLRF